MGEVAARVHLTSCRVCRAQKVASFADLSCKRVATAPAANGCSAFHHQHCPRLAATNLIAERAVPSPLAARLLPAAYQMTRRATCSLPSCTFSAQSWAQECLPCPPRWPGWVSTLHQALPHRTKQHKHCTAQHITSCPVYHYLCSSGESASVGMPSGTAHSATCLCLPHDSFCLPQLAAVAVQAGWRARS